MIKTYYFGNWKMNGSLAMVHSFQTHFQYFKPSAHQEVALFVPYPYLQAAQGIFPTLGAQDCSPYAEGSYTGEVGACMLKDLNVRYVLIGHSERRQYYHETSDILVEKCHQLQQQALIPVICLGESLEERQQNQTLKVIENQIKPFLTCHLPKIFAYEPLWAIGTGINARAQDLIEVYQFLQTLTSDPLLYGGSVKADNVQGFLDLPFINGVLVGGASLTPFSWEAIIRQ